MDRLGTIVSIARDLTRALGAEERYARLLTALRRAIPYDASALLRLEGEALVPVVCEGLSPDTMGRRFLLAEHPRLERISRSAEPVLFPSDSELPDPFDGLLVDDEGDFRPVHACLGCPLRVGSELIGVLTADAASPSAFDRIDPRFLAAIGALAAAEMHTTLLIGALEQSGERQGLIARDLMRGTQLRQGTELVGASEVMARLRRDIELGARSDFTVLITGETGVGKELAAHAVHAASTRADAPMLYVNCAALPESLAESELFGHARGAFTGATADRPGKLEVADRGTLFLDEIGELPLSVQPKLLRALQQGEIQRVGSDRAIRVDVRLIAATNRDLEAEMRAGRFRADLYHRLDVYPLRLPPLRERADDIPLLAGRFCDDARRRLGTGPVRLTAGALQALARYAWPGNVRELENVLSRATIRAAGRVPRGAPVVIGPSLLGPEFQTPTRFDESESATAAGSTTSRAAHRELLALHGLKGATRRFQRALIEEALAEQGGSWAAAARALGMDRSNLHHLAVRLGLR